MRVAMQAEVRLQMLHAHPLAAVVHAPVAAARRNPHAVHLDDQIVIRPASVDRLNGGRTLRPRCERMNPCVLEKVTVLFWNLIFESKTARRLIFHLPNAIVAFIDQWQRFVMRPAWQHLHALQVAGLVKE